MPKRTTKKGETPAALMALTFAEAVALPQDARIERFAIEALASQRAFSAMGKLYRIIEVNLEKGQSIFRLLQDAGIKKGTISNASYAAKVYDLVEQEHLTEAEYNSLAFNDCWQICRVQSKTSKRQLTANEVSALVRNSADFADDLQAIYETGMTAAEKTAVEQKVKADKAAAEAEAKAKAERDAAELAEVKKRNEELAKANADMTAAAAATTQAAATPAPAEERAATEEHHAANPPAPATPTPTPATPTAPVETAVTADDLLALLAEVETSLALLDLIGQGRVGAKLVEMASAFVESGKAVAA